MKNQMDVSKLLRIVARVKNGEENEEGRVIMKETVELEQRFLQVLKSKGNDTYTLEVTGCEVGILHGLVTLAMDHDNIEKMSQATHVARKLRQWCKGVWVKMGLSEEETDLLDQLREELSDYPHVYSLGELESSPIPAS